MESPQLLQFVNCKILRNHEIIEENLWVRNGKIVDPEKVFFDEKVQADTVIDCKNAIIAPGLIDLQINGAFGHDFSNSKDVEKGVLRVAHGLLAHGVTSFCPTVITSPVEEYHSIISKIVKKEWGKLGATVLGVHLEGPFINVQKKGAHPANLIRSFQEGFESVEEVYGNLDNVKIVTLAPELKNATEVIKKLKDMNITVSVGHSMGNLNDGEIAVHNGASLITHLFNAMLPFHHRDPGLVGLLASDNIPSDRTVYFGIISDGIHTHPSALRIAYRTHPKAANGVVWHRERGLQFLTSTSDQKSSKFVKEDPKTTSWSFSIHKCIRFSSVAGLVLVTDAISPMGLEEGSHNIGQLSVEIRNKKAFITGTNTLCGSIATMLECVKFFWEASGCSVEYALEAASLHPASALGLSNKKGTLQFGADADFILLTNDLSLISTWIAGECVYSVETVNKGSC